jgi:hypothetical protein
VAGRTWPPATTLFSSWLSFDTFGISGDVLGAASVDDPEDRGARRDEQ